MVLSDLRVSSRSLPYGLPDTGSDILGRSACSHRDTSYGLVAFAFLLAQDFFIRTKTARRSTAVILRRFRLGAFLAVPDLARGLSASLAAAVAPRQHRDRGLDTAEFRSLRGLLTLGYCDDSVH